MEGGRAVRNQKRKIKIIWICGKNIIRKKCEESIKEHPRKKKNLQEGKERVG